MKKLMLMLMVGLLLCAAITQAELLTNTSFEDDVEEPLGTPDNWSTGATTAPGAYGTGVTAIVPPLTLTLISS